MNLLQELAGRSRLLSVFRTRMLSVLSPRCWLSVLVEREMDRRSFTAHVCVSHSKSFRSSRDLPPQLPRLILDLADFRHASFPSYWRARLSRFVSHHRRVHWTSYAVLERPNGSSKGKKNQYMELMRPRRSLKVE